MRPSHVVVDEARRVSTLERQSPPASHAPATASFCFASPIRSFPLQLPTFTLPTLTILELPSFALKKTLQFGHSLHICFTGIQLLILFASRKRAPESLQSLGFVRSSPLFSARDRNVHAKRSPGSPGQHPAASFATECSWAGTLPAAVLPAGHVPASSCAAAAALRRT